MPDAESWGIATWSDVSQTNGCSETTCTLHELSPSQVTPRARGARDAEQSPQTRGKHQALVGIEGHILQCGDHDRHERACKLADHTMRPLTRFLARLICAAMLRA
jgi:hypothetical protein